MTARDGSEVTYETIEYKGNEARLYPDGAIRNAKGHWLARHPDGNIITPENASALRARGIELRQEAAAQGIANFVMKRNGDGLIVGKVSAWAAAAERMTDIMFTGKHGDGVNAFRALSDVTPSKYDKGSQQQQAAAPVQVQVDIVAVLLSHVVDKDSYLKHEAIDADISE